MSSTSPSPLLVLNGYPLALSGEGIGVYSRRLLKGLLRTIPSEHLRVVIPEPMAKAASWLPAEIVDVVPAGRVQSRRQLFLDIYWASRLGAYVKSHYTTSVFHCLREFYGWSAPEKTVTTIHDCNHWRFPASRGSAVRSLWRRATERFAARRSPLTLTVSQWAKYDLVTMAKIPAEKIHVIYNWVDPDLSRESGLARLPAVRGKLRLPGSYFLYVGGFSANKNVDFLLRAYARACAARELPVLVIAGDLDQYRRSQQRDFWDMISALDLPKEKILTTGFVASEDLPALMAGADLLVYPSKAEGFGYPAAEALAVGTPVLVADATSLTEVVRNPACRFDPTSESDLVGKLISAAGQPRAFAAELPEEFSEAYGIREYLRTLAALGFSSPVASVPRGEAVR